VLLLPARAIQIVVELWLYVVSLEMGEEGRGRGGGVLERQTEDLERCVCWCGVHSVAWEMRSSREGAGGGAGRGGRIGSGLGGQRAGSCGGLDVVRLPAPHPRAPTPPAPQMRRSSRPIAGRTGTGRDRFGFGQRAGVWMLYASPRPTPRAPTPPAPQDAPFLAPDRRTHGDGS
jgi:hypothetical protein